MSGQKDVHTHGRMREELTSYWNRAISIRRASPSWYNICCIASYYYKGYDSEYYERDLETWTHDAAIHIVITLNRILS